MKKDTGRQISGDLLVADFQSALVTRATAEYAQVEAQHNERNVVSELEYWSGQNYLNPTTINPVRQADLGRASLNAHVMKVQAAQLRKLSEEQLIGLQTQVSADYTGRKVQVTALDNGEGPFDAVWFNSNTGYRSNVLKKKFLKGAITELHLDKNLLVIKPSWFSRFLNGDLTAYFVYVIDPKTAQPAVRIDLL